MALDLSNISIGEVLSIAIRLEEDGIQFYRAASSKADSRRLRDTLSRLADQEIDHKITFQRMGRDMGIDVTGELYLRKISPANVRSLTEAGVFPHPEERDTAIASLFSLAQALRFGIRVEKGSILFYESAAKVAKAGHIRQTFNRVLAQERDHLRLLGAELKSLKAK
jgi:rubrerythrin